MMRCSLAELMLVTPVLAEAVATGVAGARLQLISHLSSDSNTIPTSMGMESERVAAAQSRSRSVICVTL